MNTVTTRGRFRRWPHWIALVYVVGCSSPKLNPPGATADAASADSAIASDASSTGSDGRPRDGGSADSPAIDSDGDGLSDAEEARLNTDPHVADSDGDGFSDGEEVFLGTNPNGPGGGCASSKAVAEPRARPVDILLIVDNSSSMADYIEAIVERINEDLAQILLDADIDYRLILISRHGAIDDYLNSCDDHGICIEPPLASGSCNADAAPKTTERFKHYSVCVDSNDGLRKVMSAFDGGQASGYYDGKTLIPLSDASDGIRTWLREGAFRTFLLVTDDNSKTPSQTFVDWLYSQDPRYFGTPERPNWRFHSIIDVKGNSAEAHAAWPADEPMITSGCWDGSGKWVGRSYQELSRLSGGLRFPYCNNNNYNFVFREVATAVTETAKISCSFTPQFTTDGGQADFSRVLVRYEGSEGSSTLNQVADAERCRPDAFYVRDQEIHLCPDTCDIVQADPSGVLTTLVACFDEATCGNGRRDAGESCDDGNREDGDGCASDCTVELI